MGRTLCGQKGSIEQSNNVVYILDVQGTRHNVTQVDREVTCLSCVRKIIGAPQKGLKLTKRKHIRRATTRLGLLKG